MSLHFKTITDLQRGLIKKEDLDPYLKKQITIELLEEMIYSTRDIASMVGYSQSMVTKINRKRKENYYRIMRTNDINNIIAGHVMSADILTKKLARDKDWQAVWKIKRELIQDLQSLGFIQQAPQRIEVSLEDVADRWEKMFGVTFGKDRLEVRNKLNASNN
ncbi:MAG: hypothetical protein ABIH71_06220 [Candidatus Omnitrophota bacterium]